MLAQTTLSQAYFLEAGTRDDIRAQNYSGSHDHKELNTELAIQNKVLVFTAKILILNPNI